MMLLRLEGRRRLLPSISGYGARIESPRRGGRSQHIHRVLIHADDAEAWMGGWMDGRTDGRMDGWMDSGWVDG